MKRLLALVLALWFLALPAAIHAQGVPRLTDRVTDQTGVLSGGLPQITSAIDRLSSDSHVDLWVLFVETTGSSSVTDYATEVATENSLGVNDALLVVALSDRRDSIWVADGLTQISNSEIDQVITNEVEPRLGAGDYVGAVVGAADGLGAAAGGTAIATPVGQGTSSGGGAAGQGSGLGQFDIRPIFLAILALVVLYIVAETILRVRRDRRTAEERDRQTGALAQEANSLLIQTDDAVKDAQQELGFAQAQFSEADVKPFSQALDQATAELKAAFTVRQQLDDAIPEDPPTRARMLGEIVERCKRARALVDDQAARLQALRDLEKNAPEILRQLPDQAAALKTRLTAVEATFGQLKTYAPACWQPVSGNVEEARKRIEFAVATGQRGSQAAEASDTGTAASAARATQEALAQATSLLDAIDRLAASLDQARDHLADAIREADADIASARAALAAGQASQDYAARLTEADTLLKTAQATAAAANPDVLAATDAAHKAHGIADEVLNGIREAAAQRVREQAALGTTLQGATAAVDQASDYIDTHRGGVGREARTRLAEASRHLDLARSATASDPATAYQEAQAASRLAGEALSIAASDFDQYDAGRRGGGSNLGGMIAGGIITGILMGGMGGRRGGFGGTPWGSSGGGFGRAGGGSFGGGGGRARGGGW